MHKNFKSVLAKSLAVAMAITMVGTVDVDAAKKPALSKKSITITAKKSKKITIKNVKAKKVKKLTVKTSKKAVATVKKNGKTAFTVTGVKAGNAVITAKVKVAKKVTTLKLKVTVKGNNNSKPESSAAASATPAASAATSATPAASAATSATPAASAAASANPVVSGEPAATETPVVEAVPSVTPLTDITWAFDDTTDETFAGWQPRWNPDDNEELGLEDTELFYTDEAKSGHALGIKNRVKPWNGISIDLSDSITEGATYRITLDMKVAKNGLTEDELDNYEDGIKIRISGGSKSEEDASDHYENYPPDFDNIVPLDEWVEISHDFTVPSALYSFELYIESQGYGKAPFLIDNVHLEMLSAPRAFDANLQSIKEAYATVGIDKVGTATTYDQLLNRNILGFINHHYNSITLGNQMKPDAVLEGNKTLTLAEAKEAGYFIPEGYENFDENKDAEGNVLVPALEFKTIDKILKLCHDNGIKLRYHTLVWHQQMPRSFFANRFAVVDEEAKDYYSTKGDGGVVSDTNVILSREELYIKTLLDHVLSSEYADVVYAIDVVNEYTHNYNRSAQHGSDNWWKYSFGDVVDLKSEYVKKAFVWAYDMLTEKKKTDSIELIYNDYNTYQPEITDQIIELINNINTKDDVNTYGKICAGVGMQCHFGDQHATIGNFTNALEKFSDAGFHIQITELDVTNTGIVKADTSEAQKEKVWADNAKMYAGIMKAIIDCQKAKNNITSVTIWGLTDATSWRDDAAPVLFGSDLADKKPSFDAVVDAALNYGK